MTAILVDKDMLVYAHDWGEYPKQERALTHLFPLHSRRARR